MSGEWCVVCLECNMSLIEGRTDTVAALFSIAIDDTVRPSVRPRTDPFVQASDLQYFCNALYCTVHYSKSTLLTLSGQTIYISIIY